MNNKDNLKAKIEAKNNGDKTFTGKNCPKCTSINTPSNKRYTYDGSCCACRTRRQYKSTPKPMDISNLLMVSPEKDLICTVVLCAVEDSKDNDKDISQPAKDWILNGNICKSYCELINIDYKSMVSELKVSW